MDVRNVVGGPKSEWPGREDVHAHVVLCFLKTQKDHKFQSVLLGSVFALLGADRGVVNKYLIIASFWAWLSLVKLDGLIQIVRRFANDALQRFKV